MNTKVISAWNEIKREKALAASTQPYSIDTSTYSTYAEPSIPIPKYYGSSTNDPAKNFNPSERRTINVVATELFRTNPVIHSAIVNKNVWASASGFDEIYRGTDKKSLEWAKLAKPVIRAARENAFPGMTWNEGLTAIGIQLDITGDLLNLFTNIYGMPRMMQYPSNMVGTRGNKTVLELGRYKGAAIDDGVILDKYGIDVAYNVLQPDKQDKTFTATNAKLIYEHKELGTRRGISILASSLKKFLTIEEIIALLCRIARNESKQGVLVGTATGNGSEFRKQADPLSPRIPGATATTTSAGTNIYDMGEITFVQAGKGQEIKSFQTSRPDTNVQDWIRYLQEQGLNDIGWPLGLINPEKLNSVNGRAMEAQIQKTVHARQQTLKRIANLFTLWVLAQAMESGEIPRNDNPDWRAWDWSMPPKFVIDSYYTAQNNLQSWAQGTVSLQSITDDWLSLREQREVEFQDCQVRADRQVKFAESLGRSLSYERALTGIGTGTGPQVSPLAEQSITSNNGEKK